MSEAKRSLTRRFLGLLVKLVIVSGIFWIGYSIGNGSSKNDQAGSLKTQLKDMTTTMLEQSPDLDVDLNMRQNFNAVKDRLLEAKEELRQKNFSKAQDTGDKLTTHYTMPQTQKQFETQINELLTRLLDVQNDVTDLKSLVTGKIDEISQDIEQLRNTATSF